MSRERSTRPALLGATILLAACATAGTKPSDMSAADHDAAALQESRAAAEHKAMYDPDDWSTGTGGCSAYCFETWSNPTTIHAQEARKHRVRAAKHRRASQALRDAEAKSCIGIAERDRDVSPFFHLEDVASVASGTDSGEPGELSVEFRPIAGVDLPASQDAGKSWVDPVALPQHTGGPEYGFVAMTPLPGDALAVFWLDGRASQGHDGGAMQLRGAEIGSGGQVTDRRLIDDRVCDCCQTSAATTPAGPVVVYRDRSADEVRDITIAGPMPDQRRVVATDGWTIAGCPVNGPAVSASKEGLVVAWFTGAAGKSAVRVAFAPTDGEFAAPIPVHLAQPLGRVDVEWVDADRALVSFIDKAGNAAGEATLVARLVSRDGKLGKPWIVAKVPASNAAGFPRMARAQDDLVWAWTEGGEAGSTIKLAEAPLNAILGANAAG